MTDTGIQTLIVLGAGGDLTSRLLLPGLGSLLASPRGRQVALVGVDREPLSDARFRSVARKAFAATPSVLGERVSKQAVYIQGDATDADDLKRVLSSVTGRVALYFAVPPSIAVKACAALAKIDFPDDIVLVLEKPFGTDLASARSLNRRLQKLVPEEQVFRVDHFLGKASVLNLLGLRFANRIFEPLLSAQNVEKVEIVFEEDLGLEGRAGYYDHAGALVDMIQSHLLLVFALASMEPPSSVGSEDLRGGMVQLLRATRPWRRDGTASRRARWTKGAIGRRQLAAYASQPGVERSRGTETLAEMTVAVDTWRWAGVPFTLRSGKAIGEPRHEVIFTFRPVPHLPNGFTGPTREARLRIGMKPGTMTLDLITNGGGDPFDLEYDEMTATFEPNELSAYGEVLSELLDGDPTLSVRGDVAEECWRIVAPVLRAWRQDKVPLDSYAAGTQGPAKWRRKSAHD